MVPAWTMPENSDFLMFTSKVAESKGWLSKTVSVRHREDRTLDIWNGFDALVS